MTEYFRVNVSSATSAPLRNEYGELKGEIEMELPENLIGNLQNVGRAEMAVMKLQVPLANIPACTLPVTSVRNNRYVNLNGSICILPFDIDSFLNGSPLPDPRTLSTIWSSNFYTTNLSARITHLYDPVYANEAEREFVQGYHNFRHMGDFLDCFNEILANSLAEIMTDSDTKAKRPHIKLELNTDNSLSLHETITSVKTVVPFGFDYRILPGSGKLSLYEVADNTPPQCFFIGVTSSIAALIPSLPWRKYMKPSDAYWPEDYIYVLDTRTAKTEVKTGSVWLDDGREQIKGSELYYHFVESDAIAMSDLASILLVMNGVAFNQQVYPINFAGRNASQALTTTVPIMEVYYPLWTRPSDHTSTLVISKETFSDAAPININPSLLRERFMKFKLYYITNSGEMREIILPEGSPFTIQIAFAITRLR